LPASDEAIAAREEALRAVKELEQLCREAEKSLMSGDWNGVANALRSSRRSTHAFRNAMETSLPARDPQFDADVRKRLERVYLIREDQLLRVERFHETVAERLRSISRWNAYARGAGARKAPVRRAGLDYTT
jgi:hypothetical protein